jgi:hypothetical protein
MRIASLFLCVAFIVGCGEPRQRWVPAYPEGTIVKIKIADRKGQITWVGHSQSWGYSVKYVDDYGNVQEGSFKEFELEPFER